MILFEYNKLIVKYMLLRRFFKLIVIFSSLSVHTMKISLFQLLFLRFCKKGETFIMPKIARGHF